MLRAEHAWMVGLTCVLAGCLFALSGGPETPAPTQPPPRPPPTVATSEPEGELWEPTEESDGLSGEVAPARENDTDAEAAAPQAPERQLLRIKAMDERLDIYVVDLPAGQQVRLGEEIDAATEDGRIIRVVIDKVFDGYASGTLSTRTGPLPAIPPRKPITGKVLGVDNERGLFVIRAGRAEGVQQGDVFTITRNGKVVHRVIVEEVMQHCSHVRSGSGTAKRPVQVGDRFSN